MTQAIAFDRQGDLSEAAQITAANLAVSFGPIQPLLDDPSVSEVMVNGFKLVYVERKGKIVKTDVKFRDNDHVAGVIDQILKPLGRVIDTKNPMVDARLPDGSRVNAVIPPAAVDGPALTIRKFGSGRLGIQDLIKFGTLTPPVAEFLKACVVARLNVVVAGGTGSGKTTLLNVLSSFIHDDERIVIIEDAAELNFHQEHVVRLETVRGEADGSGAVNIRDLVRNSLRMRPERIVVGECRGGETLDMLQAMNTGHDGSLTSLHANTPRDTISRIETMSLMAGFDLPVKVIREQLASAIELIIQQCRLRDGSRKITHITEVVGIEGDKVILQDLFRLGPGEQLTSSGIRPVFLPKLEDAGFKIAPETFSPASASPGGGAGRSRAWG